MKILRKYIRATLLESRITEGQSPEKLATLARALVATETGDKSRIGDIGEEIADMFMQGMNLNDVKDNTQFPFADVASGPISRLKDTALYSVKASGEIKFDKASGKYSGRDVFNNSYPKGSSIDDLVNKRGNKGLRDEIDEQWGEDAQEITIKLGVIAADVRPNLETGEPEGLMVRKYGPTSFTFIKDEDGNFKNPVTGISSWRGRDAVAATFGAAKVLSDPAAGGYEGRDELTPAADSGRGASYRQGAISIDPEGLASRMEKEKAIRDSLARMSDSQVDQMINALNDVVS